jgi:2-dehydropantoate 2-reductase
MKVCVFGAGAVGGHIATRLLAAQADDIALVARGSTLAAMRERGLKLRSGDGEIAAVPKVVTDDPSSLPPQDVVLVTLKAHAVPGAAAAISRLLAPQGCAVFFLNGIPWWWRHGLPGAGGTLPLLDPEGALWGQVRPERALGCVVHSPNEVTEPAVIVHTGPNHFILGEPDRTQSARLESVAGVLRRGGLDARISADLRRDVLLKLMNNASGNTIAALSRTDLGGLGADDGLRALSVAVINEALAVSAALGWDLRQEVDAEGLAGRGKPGQRPSMLQDVLQGRAIEVEALLGQVQAFAREKGVAVPTIDVILPLLRGLDRALRAA